MPPRASKRKLSTSAAPPPTTPARPRRSTAAPASAAAATPTPSSSTSSRRRATTSTPSTSHTSHPTPSTPSTSSRTPYNHSSLHRFPDRRGEALSFGSGDIAQLGLGEEASMRERKKPTLIKALQPVSVVHVAAGSLHNAVIVEGGAVYTWGCNDDGALGRDDDEWLPAPVDGPLGKEHSEGDEDTSVVQVQCGSSHTVALTASGAVYAWGTYRDANGVMGFTSTLDTATIPTLLPIAERVIMIAAGEHHDLALTEKGNVLQWGDVNHGQRAMDRHKKRKLQPTPVIVKRRGGGRGGGGVVRFEQVYAGGASSFAITTDGQVYSWGPNNYSQTGHTQPPQPKADDAKADEKEDTAVPPPPAAATDGDAAEGEEAKDGEAQEEGEQPQRKRQKKTAAAPSLFVSIPALIPSLPPILKIAAAIHHTLFLTTSHAVLAVGRNVDGRLGLGTAAPQEVSVPTATGPGGEVVDVGVGEAHSLMVVGRGEEGGALWTCGMGDLLQLGNGVEEDAKEWGRVESQQLDKEDRRVVQAVGGSQHSMILTVKRKGPLGLTQEEEEKLAQ